MQARSVARLKLYRLTVERTVTVEVRSVIRDRCIRRVVQV